MNDTPVDFHALLIGIDGYPPPIKPLAGCINDIDAVQELLITRLGVGSSAICRLTTSTDESPTPPGDAARTPTRDNIIAALQALAQERVTTGSRVLVYYSGHGSVEWRAESGAYLEGIAPLDQHTVGLIYDVELNQLFQQIANRGADLTVVLDCCHSAGATRTTDDALERVRCLPPQQERPSAEIGQTARRRGGRGNAEPELQEYTVLAACHADEQAVELPDPSCPGRWRGSLSYCLLSLLSSVSAQALPSLRFIDIWEPLKAKMAQRSRRQNPWLLGPAARRFFGGPWSKRDAGFAVHEHTDGSYHIGGGLLAGLAPGTKVAVFGEEPARLPPVGSEEEERVQLGRLVVEIADLASAKARPTPGKSRFAVPPTARARLVQLSHPDRLTVAGAESLEPAVAACLPRQDGGDNFILLPEGGPAELEIRKRADGSIWLVDERCHAFGVPDNSVFPVGVIPMDHPSRMAAGLRAALGHYSQFEVPLRLCRQASTIFQRAPTLRILSCDPASRAPTPGLEQNFTALRESARAPSGHYLVKSGAPVCIQVQNSTERNLFVSVLVCNLEGQVQLLDTNVFIARKSAHMFWADNVTNEPFRFGCPAERLWGIDRLVLISSEQRGIDLSALAQELPLQQVISDAMASRTLLVPNPRQPAIPFWSASQSVLQILNQAEPTAQS